jgi:hypothetical protein
MCPLPVSTGQCMCLSCIRLTLIRAQVINIQLTFPQNTIVAIAKEETNALSPELLLKGAMPLACEF